MIINGNGLAKMLQNKSEKMQSNVQKTLEKLASGQRIRSAANDASGLAISQKMMALSRGSHQAIRNVQDAGSLVQVADGAMQEITDIVQRIRELTVSAMNGTKTQVDGQSNAPSDADTLIMQKEIDELKKNLNDVVHNTEFNNTKLLTNTDPGKYVYENRSVSKSIQLSQLNQLRAVETEWNNVGSNTMTQVIQPKDLNTELTPQTTVSTTQPVSYIGSTVTDHNPRWSADGESIVFSSTRDGGEYVIPTDGSADPLVDSGTETAAQQKMSSDGLMRLSHSGSTLYLQKRSSETSTYWINVKTFDTYNYNDGTSGYSFSPKTDADGNTSFIFSNNEGNFQKVDVNLTSQLITSGPKEVIPSSDVLNIPAASNTLVLPSSPDLYNMNTADASFRLQKVNDNGARELTYWDGTVTEPGEGYYTVSGGSISFFGDAVIGNEAVDDAQDYYSFSYVTDGFQNEVYSTSLPTGAEVYNMHGEDGPRSLKIKVGGTEVTQSQLLSAKPTDVNATTGVLVDETNGKIEFYGDLRPSASESVSVEYLSDADARNQVQTFSITPNIDTYNLEDADLTTNRSLRVYVGGTEISYDAGKTNGYTYENGKISLYGNARPDIAVNPSVTIDYVSDSTSTTKDVYGIQLYSTPEIYNLDSETAPNSIRVYRNSTEEIAYSDTDGFQYDQATNTIELYGASRPDTGDKYTVNMIVPTGDVSQTDGKVEVPLSYYPETYGTDGPSTFQVTVDGLEVNYDDTKTNGYFYNNSTNKIELYGDARPEAGSLSNPDVHVSYVYESPSVAPRNDSYDFQLASNTLDYGVNDQMEPKAIRVYQNGTEIPYDSENGFSYDSDTNRLSLHGSYRPESDDATGDFRVYSLTTDDIQKTVPENAYVYKVEMNGQEIQPAEGPDGNGYIRNGNRIEIVGDVRPDVTNTMGSVSLNVQYFDSLEVDLNSDIPNNYFHAYCDHESGEGHMDSEIDPTYLSVSLDGNPLTSDQYRLDGNKLSLNQETLTLGLGDHTFSVDYRARKSLGYDANEFTFQVGANSGENMKVEIASFDNMLRDTNIICVRNQEDAAKGLEVIDNALEFVLDELGGVGAVENSLDHIASNLSIMEENTNASLSRIMDADMAKASMDLVKSQILSQAQQAMSARVKQSSEQILALLK